MNIIKIRFNTENTYGILVWRVLINNTEQLASEVNLQVASITSKDTLPDGRVKWHITANYTQLIWQGTKLIVT